MSVFAIMHTCRLLIDSIHVTSGEYEGQISESLPGSSLIMFAVNLLPLVAVIVLKHGLFNIP